MTVMSDKSLLGCIACMALETQQKYLRRVTNLIHKLNDCFTPAELAEVHHLVSCGEPAEGLCSLAWIIEHRQVLVVAEIKKEIVELAEGLVAREHFPESFREFFTLVLPHDKSSQSA